MAGRVYFSAIFPVVFLFSLLGAFPLQGERRSGDAIFCTACSRRIAGRYLILEGNPYCSRKCMESAFPKCSVCGKPSEKTWVAQDDPRKIFCERCRDLPKCDYCGNVGRRRSDGTVICDSCAREAVSDPSQAQEIFEELRRELKSVFNIGTNHRIRFSIVTPSELARIKKSPLDPRQKGLFQHEKQMRTEQTYNKRTGRTISRKTSVVREKFSIFVLGSLPPPEFRHAVIHELTHDWMSEYCPQIKDPAVREGTCEFVAWCFLRKTGGRDPAMQAICRRLENNQDPVYGGGFRKMRKIAGSSSPDQSIARLKSFLPGAR